MCTKINLKVNDANSINHSHKETLEKKLNHYKVVNQLKSMVYIEIYLSTS